MSASSPVDTAPTGGSRLHVAVGIDEAYVLPLLVMLMSLREHLATHRPLLHLLHRGLSPGALEAIESVIESRPVEITSTPALLRDTGAFPPEAATPLLLADHLPGNLERVLFLDADLLVLDDVGRLWSQDLEGKVLAACTDAAIPRCGSARGVKDPARWGGRADAPYFNGGVLLIDLDAWRAADVTSRAMAYFGATGARVDFLHQEALNAVLTDRWKPLSPRWNLAAGRAGRMFEWPRSDAWRDPGIVHFAGRMKPWRAPVAGHFNDRYQTVLSRAARLVDQPAPGLRERLYGHYDRWLRPVLYPCERLLWKMRVL